MQTLKGSLTHSLFAFQLKTKCAAIPNVTFSLFTSLPFVPFFSENAVSPVEYNPHGVTEQSNGHEKPIKPWNPPVA